eukprot:794111-Rhodomonas_salina.1
MAKLVHTTSTSAAMQRRVGTYTHVPVLRQHVAATTLAALSTAESNRKPCELPSSVSAPRCWHAAPKRTPWYHTPANSVPRTACSSTAYRIASCADTVPHAPHHPLLAHYYIRHSTI